MTMMAWKWMTCKRKVLSESPFWHFSEAFCRNHADMNQPTNAENLVCKLEYDVTDRPSPESLMKRLAKHYITGEIKKRKVDQCQGCLYKCDGQKSHLSGGCASEWDEAVTYHFNPSVDAVKSTVFKCWLRNVLQAMTYRPMNVKTLVKEWKADVDLEELFEDVKNEPVSECYTYFFDQLEPRV